MGLVWLGAVLYKKGKVRVRYSTATRTPSQFWQHDTRLDKTREQLLQDALVNVDSSDVRETLWTASCWFALAPRERDEAMMLSQLTFRESESLTKAGAAREETA